MIRRKKMWFVGVIAALIVGYTGAFVVSPEVRYVHRAGIEEGRILAARRPIVKMVDDTTVPAETRAQLRLVLDARAFAARLGLEAKDTYTQFADVGRDTLLLVVTASGADCICPVTWKYPFVGRVPYKGYFDLKEGRKFAAQLEARGYDVNARPSAAFSTLGWFNDPLLSTALERDSMELAALVLHEIAHNTLWVKGNVPFNESYAQLVGYRGAESFFRERGDTMNARRAAERWHDEGVLGDFYNRLVSRADSFYATHPDSASLRAGKIALAEWARGEFEGPVGAQLLSVHVTPTTIAASRPLNNARLVGITIYRSHLAAFEDWYERYHRDLRAAVAGMDTLMHGVQGETAWERLERHTADSGCLALDAPPVELHGRLGVERRFGAPNYGEDTLHDAHLRLWVLRLDPPLRVCEDDIGHAEPGVADSLRNLDVIQLTVVYPDGLAPSDTGHSIVVRGSPYFRQIGPELLPVIMMVDSVRVAH